MIARPGLRHIKEVWKECQIRREKQMGAEHMYTRYVCLIWLHGFRITEPFKVPMTRIVPDQTNH